VRKLTKSNQILFIMIVAVYKCFDFYAFALITPKPLDANSENN